MKTSTIYLYGVAAIAFAALLIILGGQVASSAEGAAGVAGGVVFVALMVVGLVLTALAILMPLFVYLIYQRLKQMEAYQEGQIKALNVIIEQLHKLRHGIDD